MANTYTQANFHLVFSPKNRDALIGKTWAAELEKYITGIIQNNNHKLLAIGSMPDHIHIFIGYNLTQLILELLARGWDYSRLETHITTFAAIKPYKQMLKEQMETPVDLSAINVFHAAGYSFAVNETTNELTSVIFKKLGVDAIIFRDPDTQFSGLLININSRLAELSGFKMAITKSIKGIEPEEQGDNANVLSITSSKAGDSIVNDLVDFIKNYFD